MKKSIRIILLASTISMSVIQCDKDDNNDDQSYQNKNPVAVISPIPTVYVEQKDCEIQFSEDIILDATQSSDPGNDKLQYKWDLETFFPFNEYVRLEPVNPENSKVKVVIRQIPASSIPVTLTVLNSTGKKSSAQVDIKIEQKFVGQPEFTLKAIPFMRFSSDAYSYHKFTGNNYWLFQKFDLGPQLFFVNPSIPSISAASQPENLTDFSVAEQNEKLFLIGGGKETKNTWSNVSEKSVYMIDKTTNQWSSAASLNIERSFPQAYSLGQKIIIGGGYIQAPNSDFSNALASIELYDPAVNKWNVLTPPGLAAWGFALAVNNGKAYVIGGYSDNAYVLTSSSIYSDRMFIYEEATGEWSESRLPDSLANVKSVASGPYIFLSGERKPRGLRNTKIAMILDTRNNSITKHCLSGVLGFSPNILAVDNKILFLPFNFSSLQKATMDMYNIQTGQWSTGKLEANPGMGMVAGYEQLQFWSYQNKIYTNDGKQVWQLNF